MISTLLVGFDPAAKQSLARGWRVMLYAPEAAFTMPWNMVDKRFNVMILGEQRRFRDPTIKWHYEEAEHG